MNRYKYAVFKRRDLMIEKFLSENANRYKNTDMHIGGSYLENLLLKMLASFNMYDKNSNEYELLSNIIRKRPNDVLEAIFICNWQGKNINEIIAEAIKKNSFDKEIDKLLVIARNLKILFKDKYKKLTNDFILGIEGDRKSVV